MRVTNLPPFGGWRYIVKIKTEVYEAKNGGVDKVPNVCSGER